MLRRSEFAESAKQLIHAADSVAQRADVLLDGRTAGGGTGRELLGHELQVKGHVVERIFPLMRETDGDALEQAGAVGGTLLRVLPGCPVDAWNRMPHVAPLAVSGTVGSDGRWAQRVVRGSFYCPTVRAPGGV